MKKNEQAYSKGQILASNTFQEYRDILGALLEDSQAYTLADVKEKIQEFKKGQVK